MFYNDKAKEMRDFTALRDICVFKCLYYPANSIIGDNIICSVPSVIIFHTKSKFCVFSNGILLLRT